MKLLLYKGCSNVVFRHLLSKKGTAIMHGNHHNRHHPRISIADLYDLRETLNILTPKPMFPLSVDRVLSVNSLKTGLFWDAILRVI